MAIESREAEITTFSMYDLKTGELLLSNQANHLSPWYSLAAFDEQGLILRYFENKQNPDQVSFIRYDPEADQLMEEISIPVNQEPAFDTPSLFLPENECFQTVTQFLDQPIVLGCEYLEQDELIIICYYLLKEKGFERKLLVLKNGKEQLHEIQDKEMSGFALGGFFTFQNRLIFVRNKTEINIYEI